MTEENFIDFELADKFNYKGLANADPPEYANMKIDFVKLLDFLKEHGEGYYNYTSFESETFTYVGSFLYDAVWGKSKRINKYPVDFINGEERGVILYADLNTKPGLINLDATFPMEFSLDPSHSKERYTIKIPYVSASEPYSEDDYAIKIHSHDFYEMIYVIKWIHHVFDKELETWIFNAFNKAFDKYKDRNQLDFLYEQAPVWVIARRDNDKVFNDLVTILGGFVDAVGTNEELAVLKIIRSFATSPYYVIDESDDTEIDVSANADYLLENSLTRKVNGLPVFRQIYKVMHDYGGDDNFSAFIQLFYLFWLESKYPKKSYGENSDTHPLILDYKSNKVLGFYNDGMDFTFKWTHIKITKTTTSYIDTGTTFIFDEQVEELSNPHIFQPIHVPEIQQDGEMKFLKNVVPAFYLKAFDDKNAWSNLEKAIWLVVDIVTTFTGVGNLLKLRHLTKVVKAYKYAKMAIAGIEVVSGTIGLMLNFVDECDDPNDDSFCNKLRTFLLYVDLATLGVDALTSKFIRNAADDALRNMPDGLRKKHPDIYEELKKVANDGVELSDEVKESIRNLLKKKELTPKFHKVNIDLLDSNGKFVFRLGKDELALYFKLVEMPKSKLRQLIKDGTKKIYADPKRKKNIFKPGSEKAKKYNLKQSNNKLCMDFDKTKKYLHSPQASFKIRLTGSRDKDFEECVRIYHEKTGIPIDDIEALRDDGLFVWHHLDDLDANLECTMQFSMVGPHSPNHCGSVSQFQEISGIKYKP